MVLVEGRFSHLLEVVAEGVAGGGYIERAACLFLAEDTHSPVEAVTAAATLTAYPLAPIQLTMISTVTNWCAQPRPRPRPQPAL